MGKGMLGWAFLAPIAILIGVRFMNKGGDRLLSNVFVGGSRWSPLLLWSWWRRFLRRRV
jgi:hypothetical protein